MTQAEKLKRKNYKNKLQGLIEEIGEWNVNCFALSKEWEIPKSTVARWKDKIVESIGPIDFTKARTEIEKGFISNIKYCQKLIKTAKTERDRISAVNAYNSSIKTFVEYQEAYGIKPKVPELLNINSQNKELTMEEQFEEFKKLDKK